MESSRLPVVAAPTRTEKAQNSHMSEIQSERAEMLATFEASSNLPLLVFARLAGKSRDQINRDIKARRLLSLSLGNRGQRMKLTAALSEVVLVNISIRSSARKRRGGSLAFL